MHVAVPDPLTKHLYVRRTASIREFGKPELNVGLEGIMRPG